jgi:hypothetical protein
MLRAVLLTSVRQQEPGLQQGLQRRLLLPALPQVLQELFLLLLVFRLLLPFSGKRLCST